MALGDLQSGPRFTTLLGQSGAEPAPPSDGSVGMSSGGASGPAGMSPQMQGAMAANATNPVHAARMAAELSRKRLLTMAQQIAKARDAL